jgi:hypothetical protein
MRITVTSRLVAGTTPERSAFTATARFFDDSTGSGSDAWSASTPTTADYRIDRIKVGEPGYWQEIVGWTTLTPAASISIPITSNDNAVQCNYARDEQRQVTVRANSGLSTQTEVTYRYRVKNLAGQA